MESVKKRYKLVISDCHLAAGRFVDQHLNPYEDFHSDEEMAGFFEYFSVGIYGEHADGSPVDVELIINGDFFDYLNVPIDGEFEEEVTEEIALQKTEEIIAGHPKVMAALKRFAGRPGKKVTYIVGNHDAELFFEQVRQRITREWDPQGQFPSESVELIADRDRLSFPEKFEIRHGNQFEQANYLNFEEPFHLDWNDRPALDLPWGSIYVLKIINRLKWERPHVDKVRPFRAFVFAGLFMDTLFTLKFCFLSAFYFLKTRFDNAKQKGLSLRETLKILLQSSQLSRDLENEARSILDQKHDLKTIIMGHTHRPMDRVYPDGKQYINTGTWTRMINLDFSGLGQHLRKTFAFIEIEGSQAKCELREWVGEYKPYQNFQI